MKLLSSFLSGKRAWFFVVLTDRDMKNIAHTMPCGPTRGRGLGNKATKIVRSHGIPFRDY